MGKATLILPRVLEESIGTTRIEVHGSTVKEALEDAFDQHPALRHHLTDDKARLRPHVLCFVGEEQKPLSQALKDGDRITIFQAISGG